MRIKAKRIIKLKGHIISARNIIAIVICAIMSIQQLLPKDILLRSLSICFETDELPNTYKTRDGKVKARNKSIFLDSYLSPLYVEPIKVAKKIINKKIRTIDKTIIDANHQTWILLKRLISDEFLIDKVYGDNILQHDINACQELCTARLGNWIGNKSKYDLSCKYNNGIMNYYRFTTLANYLEYTRDLFNKDFAAKLILWKRDGCPDRFRMHDIYVLERKIKYYQVSNSVIVRIRDRYHNSVNYNITNVHFTRVVDYLRSAAVLSIMAHDVYGMDTSMKSIIKLLSKQCDMGIISPNGVGSIYKCARQILFLRGDVSRSFGSSPVSLYIAGLDGVKARYGESIAIHLEDMTSDRKSAINLANIFRMVPHPDQDMADVFETVEGFKSSNPVETFRMSRFEGMARKAIYESLTAQKIEVRAYAKSQLDQVAISFANSINATSTPIATVLSAGYTKWSSIKFNQVKNLFDADKQEIPVSNKSSAPNASLSRAEIDKIGTDIKWNEYKDLRMRLISVNDIATSLKGTDELDFKAARKRFREVMQAHKEFESTYLAEGKTIDDIPSDDLSKFVTGNPSRAYTVCTEPKLGEVHKELTRMFYMAEQSLKVMTQVCERFVKKVISKSSGISIVKDYRSRRKELESMLNAYTGVVMGDRNNVIYISFDMSEFSKKFPQKVIRAIGEILSELSGEDWMSRVDLFFRAAIVYHNTRGFIGVKAGVTGGFEGFLNFLWTLAMKVVMDIATQATGVTGVLAVYSDDGLLRLYVDGTTEEVKAKVNVIQKVFKGYGLIFHMDKTVASPEIMEYLGVYGEKGMIVPTWIKEAMSIGRRKRTKGIETISDKITLFDSQCNAVVKAGGPPCAAALVKAFLSMSVLRRQNREAPSKLLSTLLIIPYSAGGFRISSITESSLLSSIESITEFCADLELVFDLRPAYVTAIISRITENLQTPNDARRALVSSALLQTYLPDTSSIGIIRNLLESANITTVPTADPLTNKVVDAILHVLEKSENIPIRALRTLIQSIPNVVEYNKAIALLRSDVALKFIDEKKIMRAQGSDTKRVRQSIEDWVRYMRDNQHIGFPFKSSDLCKYIIDKLYPKFSICTLSDSPRTALELVEVDADIITSLEYVDNEKLLYQEYKEPEARFLGAQLSPEFAAESSASVKQRQYDRFIANAARLVATNNSLLKLYYTVANAFNLPCPSPPSLSAISVHRSTRNFGKNAVSVHLPAPFHALILSKMSNQLWNKLCNKPSADRTTYVEAARIGNYLNLISSIDNSARQREGNTIILYKIRDVEINTDNPVFRSNVLPRRELISDHVTKSFTNMIVEENAQANAMETGVTTSGLLEIVKDTPTVKAILLSTFESWLRNCISGTHTMNQLPPHIPDPWKVDIYVESCVFVSFSICAPITRRAIQMSLSELIDISFNMGIDDTMGDPDCMAILQRAFSERTTAFEEFGINLGRVTKSLLQIEIDTRIQEKVGDISYSNKLIIRALITFLKRRSVTGGVSIPTVVINTDTFADTKMSRNVKNAIKDAVDMTMNRFLDMATRAEKWEYSNVLDPKINFLYILKNMLRPSGHRNTPFNKHMVMIQLIKFELFVRKMINEDVTEVDANVMNDYRIPLHICRAIVSQNAVIRGDSKLTSGEDMRACLLTEGVPVFCIARVNYILSKLARTYNSYSVTEANILDDDRFVHKMLNYILDTYDSIVNGSAKNIIIRHRREAERIGKSVFMTPVEEASIVCAEIYEDNFIAYEEDTETMMKYEKYATIVKNLLIAHYTRWRIDGYTSTGAVNDVLRSIGVFGGCELAIRSQTSNPFKPEELTAEYTLSISTYFDDDTMIHNYLYVNKRAGGMAVMCNDDGIPTLFSILPAGIFAINTYSTKTPIYIEGFQNTPVVYNLDEASMRLSDIGSDITLTPVSSISTVQSGALIVQQAYQSIVGITGNIEDTDAFLVAIAEIVRGSWSMEIGLRVLAMFCSWYSTSDEPKKRDHVRIAREISRRSKSGISSERMRVTNAASAVWTWFRHSNIVPGPNINTELVSKIVNFVSTDTTHGGFPAAFFTHAPKSVEEVKLSRGIRLIDEIIIDILDELYIPPRVSNVMELEAEDPDFYDYDDDDDW